ncbi:MAG: hypothetical protein JXC36_09080 [Candidatus Atribacteria bacterium]|nr:hypothetical protein [Candidatus Atribacteria bacterium]
MDSKKELRRADFVTSILLIMFGLWVLYEAMHMPMKDTFGGVQNVWYVSPALFPLIISFFIIVLGFTLFLNSIRTGGAKYFIDTAVKTSLRRIFAPTETGIRFLAILIAMFTLIYLYIPRMDFFISASLFLFFLISIFYFDQPDLLKKLTIFFMAGNLLFTLIWLLGWAGRFMDIYKYLMDIFLFVFFMIYLIYTWQLIRNVQNLKSKYFISLLVAVGVPLFLCPVFRFFLLVPLPYEGFFIEIMHLLYYAVQ